MELGSSQSSQGSAAASSADAKIAPPALSETQMASYPESSVPSYEIGHACPCCLQSTLFESPIRSLRFLALSATIPNIQDISLWLEAKHLEFGENYRYSILIDLLTARSFTVSV